VEVRGSTKTRTDISRASLTDLYLHTKFHQNRKNFLQTDGRTYCRTSEPHIEIIRSTLRSQPENDSSLTIHLRRGFPRAVAADSRCDTHRRTRHTSAACQAHVCHHTQSTSSVCTDDWDYHYSDHTRPCFLLQRYTHIYTPIVCFVLNGDVAS